MKKTFESVMMLLVILLVAAFLGTTLMGCTLPSDDEEEPKPTICPASPTLVGSWQYVGATYDSSFGLIFQEDGKVKWWDDYMEYKESDMGTWGFDWKTGNFIITTDVSSDAPYYTVMELTDTRLVLRVWGGFPTTPFEEGRDQEYKRISER